MNVFNLNSSMQDPQDVVLEEVEIEPIIAPQFQFTEILHVFSDFNTKHESGRHKLIARQTAGRGRDIHNVLMAGNAVILKAADLKKGQTRAEGLRTVLLTIRRTGHNLQEHLNQALNDTRQTLETMYKIPKQPLPPGMEPGVISLIECGLIQAPKKPGVEMWKLPDPIINALGIRKSLPSPYDKHRLEQIEVVEEAIQILESLFPFIQGLQQWKWGDKHQGNIEAEGE